MFIDAGMRAPGWLLRHYYPKLFPLWLKQAEKLGLVKHRVRQQAAKTKLRKCHREDRDREYKVLVLESTYFLPTPAYINEVGLRQHTIFTQQSWGSVGDGCFRLALTLPTTRDPLL